MIIVMREGATQEQIDAVIERLTKAGVEVHTSVGRYRTVLGVVGDEELVAGLPLEAMPGVEKVMPVLKPYKLVSREFQHESTVIDVRGSTIGPPVFAVIAGPCSVETEEQMIETARFVKQAGATFLRGGAFKPRTSPYSFQGLGEEGLRYLKLASEETGLPVVTEVMEIRQIEVVSEYADVVQIGARNMQNFNLLLEVGKQDKPVLLKRGFSNTIEELLTAAEYIARGGNRKIVLCERGIRTFETATRNTLDISAIPIIKQLSHLPVIVDPSHAAGRADLVAPLSLAALAVGADGVIVEVHPRPAEALCDGPQSLDFPRFEAMMTEIRELAPVVGRVLARKE
jgi:3-deoxy-7-phosphoheptulonate synthase